MELLTNALTLVDSWLGSAAYFPFLLLGTGLILTVYLGFPQIRFFNHAWRIVRGKYDKPGMEGDASHFQALSTAISGTVGTGNIGGVALAIYLGGPAALFWMWMTAFFGMTTKFAEVSLSHKYRRKDADGHIVGGPMFVIEKRLNMKWLAVFFAIATVVSSFGAGNMPQANNIAQGLEGTAGIPPWISGAVLAVLLGLVLLGGVRRIIQVAEKIVPLMAAIYILGALAVIIPNLEQVGESFVAVFRDAFTGSAASGGFLGATFAYAFNRGVARGLFSNEAGQGSAPIAHAAARADEPISEGMVSILEPFIDTIIICTLTGMVILASGVWTEKHPTLFQRADMEFLDGRYDDTVADDRAALFTHLNSIGGSDAVPSFTGTLAVVNGRLQPPDGAGVTLIHNRSIAERVEYRKDGELVNGQVEVQSGALVDDGIVVNGHSLLQSVDLTARAFTRGWLGESGKFVVSVGLVLFAFSTAVAWSYYGDRAVTYLIGTRWLMPYRALYVVGFFMATIMDTSIIWLISYVTVALMTLPNLVSLLYLHREMKETVGDYWRKFDEEHPEGR